MSISRTVLIYCDGCGGVLSGGDIGEKTAAVARFEARFDGAHTALPGGRDICADCWDDGER